MHVFSTRCDKIKQKNVSENATSLANQVSYRRCGYLVSQDEIFSLVASVKNAMLEIDVFEEKQMIDFELYSHTDKYSPITNMLQADATPLQAVSSDTPATEIDFRMSSNFVGNVPRPRPAHIPQAQWDLYFVNHIEPRYFSAAKRGVEDLFQVMELRQGSSATLMGERSTVLEDASMDVYQSKARSLLYVHVFN
jgi:hypothetical protein